MAGASVTKKSGQNALDESYECTQCSAKFSYKKTLNRHMRNIHSALGKPVVCEFCNSRFNDKWAMTKHIESTHMKKHHVLICPICHYEDSKVMIDIHFAKAHGIQLKVEMHHFDSLEEFDKWKNHIELTTVARFVVNQKFRKKNGAERIIYNCHRSGFFKPRGKNKRNIKSQGTNKIMGFCPARLEFEAEETGGVSVQFIKTHVGHKNEAEKVFSQLEMKLFRRPPRSVGIQTKKNDRPVYDTSEPELHLNDDVTGSNLDFCQLVNGNGLSTVQFKPVVVREYSYDNNIISIFTAPIEEGRASPVEDAEESESAALAPGLTINGITTVDLDGKMIRVVDMSNILSAALTKEDTTEKTDEGEERLDIVSSLDIRNLLGNRLNSLQGPLKLCQIEDRDRSDISTDESFMELNGQEYRDDNIAGTSSELCQLTVQKRGLIERFTNLINSAYNGDILEKIKDICEPTLETVEAFLQQDVLIDLTSDGENV